MKKRLGYVKIRHKIIIIFLSLLILTTIFTLVITWQGSRKDAERQMREMSDQTLNALDNSLHLIVNQVQQGSYTIFWNPAVQDILAGIGEDEPDPATRSVVEESLINMMLSGDYISSIILYDGYGNSYDCVRSGTMVKNEINVKDMPWYDEAEEMDGEFIFVPNSGVASFSPKENVLSMIKVIKSSDDYSELGIVAVNIAESVIQQYFDEIGGEYWTQFYVMDQDEELFGPKETEKRIEMKDILDDIARTPASYKQINGEWMLVNSVESQVAGWTLVSLSAVDRIEPASTAGTTLVLLFVNAVLVLICGEFIRHILSNPLKEMEEHIHNDEKGLISPMKVDEGVHDEISELKRVYNAMQDSIHRLIEKIKEEDETIRRNELELIRAQINPHFLYNTLDAISAMALIGDGKNCFKMTRALEMFYRDTLSSGRSLVTVNEEINCIKNYMTIINMRSDSEIHVDYDVEEALLQEPMMKLLLQPFVENSVQHGLRSRTGGRIWIGVQEENEMISLSVSDNGSGMTEQKAKELLLENRQKKKSGFGVYSAVQRIRLFYGLEDPIAIRSCPGKGTSVGILIRRIKEERDEDQSVDR